MFFEFQRTSSSASSNNDDNSVQSYRALLKERLLITQPNDDNDDDMFDFRESRMSRDTDYETDLDMDYDGEFQRFVSLSCVKCFRFYDNYM